MTNGWIYILISPGLHKDLLKIGRTSKAPEDRARELSSATGVPAEYRVAYDVYVQDCIMAERIIHQRLQSYRYVKNKEFFMLPLKQAIKLVDDVVSQAGDANDTLAEKEYILPEVIEVLEPTDDEEPDETTANTKEGGRKLTQIELMKMLSEKYDFTVRKGSRSEGSGIIASKNGKSYNIKFSYSRSYFDYIKEEVRCSGWHTLFEREIENSIFQFFVFVVADAANEFHYFIFKSEDIIKEFDFKVYDNKKRLHFYFRVKNDGRPVELREAEKDMSVYYNNWDVFSNVS